MRMIDTDFWLNAVFRESPTIAMKLGGASARETQGLKAVSLRAAVVRVNSCPDTYLAYACKMPMAQTYTLNIALLRASVSPWWMFFVKVAR